MAVWPVKCFSSHTNNTLSHESDDLISGETPRSFRLHRVLEVLRDYR